MAMLSIRSPFAGVIGIELQRLALLEVLSLDKRQASNPGVDYDRCIRCLLPVPRFAAPWPPPKHKKRRYSPCTAG